ncbi:hypothetical protein Q1695_016069 [Nippostrongylus brasiliensis]|nr:hypothetical protein Q1695_016069 [Nippostrongylus brasiliensis]
MRIIIFILLLLWTSRALDEVNAPNPVFYRQLRELIDSGSVVYQNDFVYEDKCGKAVAMYTSDKSYWTCRTDDDLLCNESIPISNENGTMSCSTDQDCPTSIKCQKDENTTRLGMCCIEDVCEGRVPTLYYLNPYPVLHECAEDLECGDDKAYECGKHYSDNDRGVCCPLPAWRSKLRRTVEEDQLNLYKERNEERIRRRKSNRRDVTYLIGLVGIPLMLVLGTCVYQVKIERDRCVRDRIVDDYIRTRKASF